ncbi:unnamed protein product [Ectocarpus sp. 4 AP-2014]
MDSFEVAELEAELALPEGRVANAVGARQAATTPAATPAAGRWTSRMRRNYAAAATAASGVQPCWQLSADRCRTGGVCSGYPAGGFYHSNSKWLEVEGASSRSSSANRLSAAAGPPRHDVDAAQLRTSSRSSEFSFCPSCQQQPQHQQQQCFEHDPCTVTELRAKLAQTARKLKQVQAERAAVQAERAAVRAETAVVRAKREKAEEKILQQKAQLSDVARRLGESTADGGATDGGGTGGYGGNDGSGSRPTGVGSGGGSAGDMLSHQRGIDAHGCAVTVTTKRCSPAVVETTTPPTPPVQQQSRQLEVTTMSPFKGKKLNIRRKNGTEQRDGGGYAEEVGDRRRSTSSSSSDDGLDVVWFGALMRPFDPGKRLLLGSSRGGPVVGVDTPFDRGKILGWQRLRRVGYDRSSGGSHGETGARRRGVLAEV